MIKIFCDICGKNATKGYLANLYKRGPEPSRTTINVDLCQGCVDKIQKGEMIPSKEKEPRKTKKPEISEKSEKGGRKSSLDLGKIWALAHGKQPWTCEQIAEEMGCAASTVSYHLKKMKAEKGEQE